MISSQLSAARWRLKWLVGPALRFDADIVTRLTVPVIRHSILILSLAATIASAQDVSWPQWRGPRNNGSISDAAVYPTAWSAASNILWRVPLPGKGCSTPIVLKNCIYVTAPIDKTNAVLAFDMEGKQLWSTPLGPETAGKHQNGSGCNPSPVTDGQSIFVHFKSGAFAALDLDGKVRWQLNLVDQWGKDTLYWDYGSSPVLTRKDVIVTVMHAGSNSCVAAFDKLTGVMHWRVSRVFKTALEGDHSYATPSVFTEQGREAILVWGGEHLSAHDAANGETMWVCGNFNPKAVQLWPAVASPLIVDDMAIVPYARGETLHGIKLGGRGDVTATHRAWLREKNGAFVPTPSEYKGLVYVLRDEGQVECINPTNGATVWHDAFPKESTKYYSSPLIANGLLYASREDGVVHVAKVEGKFEVLATNNFSEQVIASPVPVAGRVLFRSDKALYCVGTTGAK